MTAGPRPGKPSGDRPKADRASLVADARLAALMRDGLLAPPLVHSAAPPPRRPVASWGQIEAELAADRADAESGRPPAGPPAEVPAAGRRPGRRAAP